MLSRPGSKVAREPVHTTIVCWVRSQPPTFPEYLPDLE